MDQDDDNTQGIVMAVIGAVIAGVIALVIGLGIWKSNQTPAPQAAAVEDIAPVGPALAKVYFALGEARLTEEDKKVVELTRNTLAGRPQAIVLLSGFHDPSGDAARNAELAKARAEAVRDALIADGIEPARIKMRKPESTVGSGTPEEGRRVEIRVQ